MLKYFDSQTIFFEVLGYGISYLEFMGVITGAIAVWLSARGKIISWPLGIANVILSFFLYFQKQFYPDMFLQIFFLITNIMGWWRWANPGQGEEDSNRQLRITRMEPGQWILFGLVGSIGTLVLGYAASMLHIWFASVFTVPSAFPYVDSFVTVMSIVATYLMVQKKVECWAVWIVLDAVATEIYFVREIRFYSLLYLIFCFIAAYGFYNWLKEFRSYNLKTT